MITASQIRAARAMLALSLTELAAAAGLSVDALGHAELAGLAGEEADRLKVVIEGKGAVFVAAGEGDPGLGAGVRLRSQTHDEGIRPQNLNAANDG